jgi:hypothetical protein
VVIQNHRLILDNGGRITKFLQIRLQILIGRDLRPRKNKLDLRTSIRADRVIPFRESVMSYDSDLLHLAVGDRDAFFVYFSVKECLDCKAC